ncbi:MAG TPA: ATP-binding protein [Saprospiraceae bacterium]|nr:ATP-binding protein [Saprospiraceae bacterium]
MIGRKKEIQILTKAYTSGKPELIAVFGRRRVGKTYLIRQYFKDKIDFELTGLKDGTKQQQLRNFSYSMKEALKVDEVPHTPLDWLEAFHQLKVLLESGDDTSERKVVFIDELPWMAAGRSDFLTGLSYFWNSYASKANIVVVICGSATAWMTQKIINDKGGLHNRVTQQIHLQPFTLTETEEFLKHKNVFLDRYQIVLIYMAMGGIPLYLEQIQEGQSAVQNIDRICFHHHGFLRNEFDNLYSALFSNADRYMLIVAALSSSWKGIERSEIVKLTEIKDGGGLSSMLRDLEMSGFISSYVPFGKKKKNTLYRLIDCYSLFYVRFIQNIPKTETASYQTLSQTQTWKTWTGYAYENICLLHIHNIKAALGVAGVQTSQYSFMAKATDEYEGAQIDMLIDRNDNVINLCEIKFYNEEMVLTKVDAENIRKKKSIFKFITKTKKQVFVTLITTFGMHQSKNTLGLIDNVLTVDSLFE